MPKLRSVTVPNIDFDPPVYACRRADEKFAIDGNLEKPVWRDARWTDDFVDIEGPDNRPPPAKRTRVKMLWDAECLYVGAELCEDHIWATVTERDSVIFRENDFEVFFDPGNTTHAYGEIEINALGTVWDLFLTKPYRDGGLPVDGYDVKGLRTAVAVDGRLNDPAADNRGWTVEMAIPWASVFGGGQRAEPPERGGFWRMNFSRVNWRTEAADGGYRKAVDPATGTPFREHNWVWAPTGLVNIHYPELWGYVFFVDAHDAAPCLPADERVKWLLRRFYYRQRAYRAETGRYTDRLALLGEETTGASAPRIEVTRDMFQITMTAPSGAAYAIRQDGLVWRADDGA